MALKNDDVISNNTSGSTGATGYAQQQATATPHDGKNKSWSFSNPQAFGSAPLARGQGSEYIIKLRDILVKKFETAPPTYAYKLLSLDRALDTRLHFSALVFCMTENNSTNKNVVFHTLILEASNVAIMPLMKPIGSQMDPSQQMYQGGTVEVFRPSTDAFNEGLMVMVNDLVRKEYPNYKQFPTMATVIPRNFNVLDTGLVHQLSVSIGLANSTEFDMMRSDFQDINLGLMVNDSNLQISQTYSKATTSDAVDNPIRSDISVSFTSKSKTNNSDSALNSGEQNNQISQLTAFVDMMYSPVVPQNLGFAGYQQPQQLDPSIVATQTYAARLVITSMTNYFVTTLPGQLLSMLTAFAASENGNWMQTFLASSRVSNGKPFLMHDIGGLGYESTISPGLPLDTISDKFKPEDLGKLIGMLVRPGLTLSIDVPDCSPDSWQLKVFSAAANDDAGAIENIYNAANYLTNGNFTKHFVKGTPMFTDKGNRIHLGYYSDKSGERHDIRNLDYLAVANRFGKDYPGTLREWTDTFAQTNMPLIPRLAARKKIIVAMESTAELTGYAHRVTPSSQFWIALALACRDVGFSPILSNQYGTAGMNNQRGVSNFVTESAVGMNNGVFQSGFGGGGYSGPATFGYSGNKRW